METLPKYTAANLQERRGVIAVASALNELGLIWRETPMADVGIDGQIEHVDSDGNASGRLIAVQIKSGPSHFHDGGDSWLFSPAPKHRFYWERFPLPVLAILHDPNSNKSYWADVRRFLRTPKAAELPVPISKRSVLQATQPEELFEGYALLDQPFMDLDGVLRYLVNTTSSSPSFPVSYFDLFCNGLTNICRTLYFGMDVAMTIAESKLGSQNPPLGVGVGDVEHEFLFGFIRFLVHQHIADIDFGDCLIDWHERALQPTFMAPLTSRGRSLVVKIQALQAEYRNSGQLQMSGQVAQEDFVRMEFSPSHYDRIGAIDEFSKLHIRMMANR